MPQRAPLRTPLSPHGPRGPRRPHSRRRTAAVVAAVVAAGTVALGPAAQAQDRAQAQEQAQAQAQEQAQAQAQNPATSRADSTAAPLNYVALGDSYSAGSGILPLDPAAPALCLRSSANYPHVIADRTGARLTDVTCGAATTRHFTAAQYPGVPPQLDAVGADTELATLTIGGNDGNTFIGAVLACGSAGIATGGKGNPCERIHGDRFTEQIKNRTYPAVKEALRALRAKAPKARVAVLGYPWILPAKADPSCFAKLPIAEGDVPYLRDLQRTLNDTVRRAAEETGGTYVDTATPSEGHDACAPRAERWMEPAFFGTNFAPVHPNARGEAAMADTTLRTLGL